MPAHHVLVASTGRIGLNLPMANVKAGIVEAATVLGDTPEHAAEAAEAILTSDTRPKALAVEFKLGGKKVRIGGICKGAGMIQRHERHGTASSRSTAHATMLCLLQPTRPSTEGSANTALQRQCPQLSLHYGGRRHERDDTVLVLANGLAGNESSSSELKLKAFREALNHVCLDWPR
jgi:glutamate N-acetyltransferase/amino-acid N-acetyltransferase